MQTSLSGLTGNLQSFDTCTSSRSGCGACAPVFCSPCSSETDDDDMSTCFDPRGNVASAPTVLSSTTALIANPRRRVAKIRNLSTDPLYIKFGDGCTAVLGGFTEMLPGAPVIDDWYGSYFVDIENYTGLISVAGSNLRYVAFEIYQT